MWICRSRSCDGKKNRFSAEKKKYSVYKINKGRQEIPFMC